MTCTTGDECGGCATRQERTKLMQGEVHLKQQRDGWSNMDAAEKKMEEVVGRVREQEVELQGERRLSNANCT